MLNRANYNFDTKDDIKEIKNKLIKEVINTERFFDPVKNESRKKEIIQELENSAETIAKNCFMKKEEETKKFEAFAEKNRQENEKMKQNFQKAINNISQENNNLKRKIEEMRRPPPPPPQPQVNYFHATPYTGVSIVDGLAAIGENRTYAYRAQIAARNGIGGYTGTPEQNTHMLNLLKQGRLIKP